MIREIKRHKIAYLVLSLVLLGFVITFLHLWPNRSSQSLLAVVMGVFYFAWGVVVHKRSKHINPKVVFEYLAVSVLAVSLLLLLLN